MMRPQSRPPIDASPSITMNAVNEYCRQTGRDMSMTAVSAMAVQNIACHAGLMVEAPGCPAMPVGQFINLLAPSGFGKTSTIGACSRSLRQFADEECESAQRRLEVDPTGPPAPIIFHSDSTPEEVLDSFRHQTATAILTSEGAMMTDLQHRGPPPAFNDAYSGEGIRQRRIGRPSVNQPKAKLASFIATQPDSLVDHFVKNNGAAFFNGNSARGIYAMPVTRGTPQTYTNGSLKSPHLDAYNDRNYEMLRITQRDKRANTLKMDAQVQEMWFGLRQQCDCQLASGQWTGHHQGWILRLPEKVLRLAAQFRFSESLDGSDIDALSMQRAIAWGYWFADEYLRLFGTMGWLTREVRDADITWQALVDYVATYRDFSYLNQDNINTLCQEKLKTKARTQKAIKLLVHIGKITPFQLGKKVHFQMHPAIIDHLLAPSQYTQFRYQNQLGLGC